MPIEDGRDIREEEQDFAVILDRYLCLFDRLWFELTGDFKTYWDAWWSAIAMMLPYPDDSIPMRGHVPSIPVDEYWRRHCDPQAGFDFTEYGPHERLIRCLVGQYPKVESSLARFCQLSEPWHVLRSWISYCVSVGIDPPYSSTDHDRMIHLPEDFNMDFSPEDLITRSSNTEIPTFLYLSPEQRVGKARRFILEELLPIMVPVLILEIVFGRSIPEDLLRHFEEEGLLQDGVLVRPTFKENPESVFEDCSDALFDSSSF